jgi:hypothetical protein
MPKPSLVTVIVEDERHEMLVRRYLRRRGMEPRQMTFVPSPSGRGSAEQWVRARFGKEVNACRNRQARKTTTGLIIVIDADIHTVRRRMDQLDEALAESGAEPIENDEQIVRLVPKRNVETWILCLNKHAVDEVTDYKGTGNDWTGLIPRASEALYRWTRPNTVLPNFCTDSLRHGIMELNRLRF